MSNIFKYLDVAESLGVVGSPSDSFKATVDILHVSENSKLLGELVCFTVQEDENTVLVLGQITEIETKNRWHEEPSFKGIIKRHGKLPNLSEVADNRIAKISVQSSFIVASDESKAHKLANSPSTGVPVKKVNNDIMGELVKEHEGLVCLGKAYDTDVSVPFWFKHFGHPNEGGAGDAYHIGVFGRTGSGKTTAAANMILGYARHSKNMSILILDPQEQFYEDNNVLPGDKSFEDEILSTGMAYRKYKVPAEVALPDDPRLFSELLLNYGFIKSAFSILTDEKAQLMREVIQEYITSRIEKGNIELGSDPDKLLKDMLSYFLDKNGQKAIEPLKKVYSMKGKIEEVKASIESVLNNPKDSSRTIWANTISLFSKKNNKVALSEIVEEVVTQKGRVIVLNISGRDSLKGMDDIQALYVKTIEDAIKDKGAEMYADRDPSNCLVVLDEAHRFISAEGIKELTNSIIDAVRTTRKYGIGYMFITQTIDSLDEDIRRQIRISAFGYGLTSGSEFGKIKDIINDPAAAQFYRSFIDPSSNQKFPFMFHGPISPLSFTGAPLFLEMNGLISDFPNGDKSQSGEVTDSSRSSNGNSTPPTDEMSENVSFESDDKPQPGTSSGPQEPRLF